MIITLIATAVAALTALAIVHAQGGRTAMEANVAGRPTPAKSGRIEANGIAYPRLTIQADAARSPYPPPEGAVMPRLLWFLAIIVARNLERHFARELRGRILFERSQQKRTPLGLLARALPAA